MRKKNYLIMLSPNLVNSKIQVVLFLPHCHAILSLRNPPLPLLYSLYHLKHKFCTFCEAFSLFIHSNCSCVNYCIYDLIYNEFITCTSAPLLLVHYTFFILVKCQLWYLTSRRYSKNVEYIKVEAHFKSLHDSWYGGDILQHSFW